MKIKISNEEIRKYLEIEALEFPKYTTQILNLANQNAQGTRPRIVGQMSDLIKHFTGKTKLSLPESIPVKPIYYKKIKNGIEVEYEL